MNMLPRKVMLPMLQLTEVTNKADSRAIERVIYLGDGANAFTYHYRIVCDQVTGLVAQYNLFPVVLDRTGAPWALGTLFVLAELEGAISPKLATYQCMADDIGAFKEWLDGHDRPDELLRQFPRMKLSRVTYRYRGYVKSLVDSGDLGASTANRRMNRVVQFYKWLKKIEYVVPEFPTWEEKSFRLAVNTADGRGLIKTVTSTDMGIRVPKAQDPLGQIIHDGGPLRPLPSREQHWLIEAIKASENTECYLLHLFMLTTGARIQTAGTLRVKHFAKFDPVFSASPASVGEVLKLRAGPGTAIDTKYDKLGVLYVPRAIYELLHTYSVSARAAERRARFARKHGEHPDPYLFLTQHGNPYYQSQADCHRFDPSFDCHHRKIGQTIRQFVNDWVIPYVRNRYDENFRYRIHDLRATYGMNLTEHFSDQVQKGKISLHQARTIVREMMWHKQFSTTDQYLNYRGHLEAFFEAVNGYGAQMQEWIAQAMSKTVDRS